MILEIEHPIIKGTDKYAFGLAMTGRFQIFRNDNDGRNLDQIFATIFFFSDDQSLPEKPVYEDDEIETNLFYDNWNYKATERVRGSGYYKEINEKRGPFGLAIRSIRYRPLPYEIYDNGTEIIKIKNGDTIPSGYTIIPKGVLRGAWFGNPNLTRSQLATCESYVMGRFYNGNANGGIG